MSICVIGINVFKLPRNKNTEEKERKRDALSQKKSDTTSAQWHISSFL